MIKQLEPAMKIESKEIKKFLDIKFNKLLVHKIMTEKYFFDNPNKPEKIRRLKNLNISIDQYDRWIRDCRKEDSKKNLPHNKNTLLNLAGVMDIDPFFLYNFYYHKFQDLITSLDNPFIINMINWNDIHKSLLFILDFLEPSKEFPKKYIYDYWSNSINDKAGWIVKDINKSKIKDQIQIINVQPDTSIKRQAFHIAYKRTKPLKTLELWQEYKLIVIRPLEDFADYTECNFKRDILKNKIDRVKVVMCFNKSGEFRYSVFNNNSPIQIKFKDYQCDYKIASFHTFTTDFINS